MPGMGEGMPVPAAWWWCRRCSEDGIRCCCWAFCGELAVSGEFAMYGSLRLGEGEARPLEARLRCSGEGTRLVGEGDHVGEGEGPLWRFAAGDGILLVGEMSVLAAPG